MELRVACARYFRVTCLTVLDRASVEVRRLRPDALCFDFDRPDRQRLLAMRELKREFERLPVLMLTQEHSEALALWAFRSQVWNYLVKPVPVAEWDESIGIIAEIVRNASPPRVVHRLNPLVPQDLAAAPSDTHTARLYPALEYVRRNFSNKCAEAEAASSCGMTRFAFSRQFHEVFGVTFREHVIRARIAEARRLLAEGATSITEVAYATGFNDASYFARAFRRFVGKPPSEYRETGIASRRSTGSQNKPRTAVERHEETVE